MVGQDAYQRLYYHTHQRRKNPEETELVRIGTESGEDTRYISTLEGVGYLNAEKAETEIKQLLEREITLLHIILKSNSNHLQTYY